MFGKEVTVLIDTGSTYHQRCKQHASKSNTIWSESKDLNDLGRCTIKPFKIETKTEEPV